MKEKVKSFQPRKIEVDQSWALINSCMKTFNEINVKRYLNITIDLVQRKYNSGEMKDFSIIHICVSHMTKTYANKARKLSGKNKKLFQFLMKIFVLLSNKTNFETLRTDLEAIMTVLLSPNKAEYTEIAEQDIADFQYDDNSYKFDMDLNGDDDASTNDKRIDDYMDIDQQTIGEASPWRKLGQEVKSEINDLIKENDTVSSEKVEKNPLYSPEAVDMLINQFLYIYPLWSGLLLGPLNRYATDPISMEKDANISETRASNAIVVAWFSIVKKEHIQRKTKTRTFIFYYYIKKKS